MKWKLGSMWLVPALVLTLSLIFFVADRAMWAKMNPLVGGKIYFGRVLVENEEYLGTLTERRFRHNTHLEVALERHTSVGSTNITGIDNAGDGEWDKITYCTTSVSAPSAGEECAIAINDAGRWTTVVENSPIPSALELKQLERQMIDMSIDALSAAAKRLQHERFQTYPPRKEEPTDNRLLIPGLRT
jgi:hypothetical protein